VSNLRTYATAGLIAFAAMACISATTRYDEGTRILVVRAIAHEWWWEFDYPTLGISDANELYIPTGTNIRLQLVSADVIHSLWIPGLNKAIPIIPGTANSLNFLVKSPGHFYGNCDAGCGCNSVCMRFPVIAESVVDFARWMTLRRSGAFHPLHATGAPACALKLTAMPRDSSKIGAKSLGDSIYSAHAHRLENLSENSHFN
jgi:cytochrome c oxidase subunit II